MSKTTLKVEGMTCGHCVMHVTKALKAVIGVQDAQVSLEKAEALVSGEGSLDASTLVRAVESAGYKARPA